jgi:hypothetical protein
MLSTFDANFQRVRDVEQAAIDSLSRGGMRGDGLLAEAEYHCQGYNPGGPVSQRDVVIACRIKVHPTTGNRRFTFTLNGKRIACHKIALQLGSLGV